MGDFVFVEGLPRSEVLQWVTKCLWKGYRCPQSHSGPLSVVENALAVRGPCGKLDPTTSRGRTSLTPNELNIELSYIFLFRFDLESSLERNVISYFYIRSCLIAYSFVHLVPRPGKGFR